MDLVRARVGIVGGGIGGLAAAIALSARGAEVRIFERAEDRRREGVALLLWANAMKALGSLGIYEAVRGRAAAIDITEVRNARGDLLCELPICEWSRSGSVPTVAVRRPDLVAALSRALPPDVVCRSAVLASFAVHGSTVVARFAGGDELELDLLIGADGLRSTVRTQLVEHAPPRPPHQRAWVGVARGVRGLLRPGVTTATIGRGPRFWAAPLDDDSAFWYATINDAGDGSDGVDRLSRELAGWHAPIEDLLAATRDDDVVHTRIWDRPPADRWREGPVTLLGDAAHAATPDLGQGACQAIESAAVLAACLERSATIAEGLRDYERRPIERTATIERMCWLMSMHTTIESAVLCSVRDAAIRLGLRRLARGHLTWILAGAEC
jgi:2-polyprenyl-6-methoxyphenol hydroxylase-like FAD-dependent oxidoreductase